MTKPEPPSVEDFISLQSPAQGAVLLDRRGRVLAIDAVAQAIFAELGVFDDQPVDALAAERVHWGLTYISHTLAEIFDARDESSYNVPALRIWAHRTGIVLRLRGFALNDRLEPKNFVVVVERGELAAHRQQRLMLRWGLSPREYEIMCLLAIGRRGREIATAIDVALGTLKTYLRRIAEKLGVSTYAGLRQFAVKAFLPVPSVPNGQTEASRSFVSA